MIKTKRQKNKHNNKGQHKTSKINKTKKLRVKMKHTNKTLEKEDNEKQF